MKGWHKIAPSLNWITHHVHPRPIQRPVGKRGWYLDLISCVLLSDNYEAICSDSKGQTFLNESILIQLSNAPG